MKILFINPWTKSLFGDERQVSGHPHIGLSYLIAACKKEGYKDIKVFDQGLEKDDSRLFSLISSYNPDLIGVTTFSFCYKYAKAVIDGIKDKYPGVLLIAGGPHVSATKEHVLKTTKADFAMKSECEISFIKFLKELERTSRDLSSINNLIWRDGSIIIENRTEEYIKDLDSIPFPDYEAFGIERYPSYNQHSMPLITSRGCPYGCNYCCIRLTMGRNFRARSAENVVAEMKYLNDTCQINHFEINDDCFAFDAKRAERICDLITESRLNIRYELYNGIRADNVSEQLLRKMKKSGCIFISYGCESGNQEIVNKYIGKNLDLEKVVQAVNLTNKAGIRNSVNFIIGHPGETYKRASETLKFAASLKTNFVNIYNLIPYPGTELFGWISKNAKFTMPVEDYLERVGSRDFPPVFETKEFTKEERARALKKGYALYELTVLQFRLGRALGLIIYLLCRNRFIFKLGRSLVFDGKAGARIYRLLSRKSKAISKTYASERE
jgi:radical SAM superfamily enzyme YgiQ (UPF0313 family)